MMYVYNPAHGTYYTVFHWQIRHLLKSFFFLYRPPRRQTEKNHAKPEEPNRGKFRQFELGGGDTLYILSYGIPANDLVGVFFTCIKGNKLYVNK